MATKHKKDYIDQVLEAAVVASLTEYLIEDRRVLKSSSIKYVKEIRSFLNSISEEIIKSYDKNLKEDGIQEAIKLNNNVYKEVSAILKKSVADIDMVFRGYLQKFIERKVKGTLKTLTSLGIGTISNEEVQKFTRILMNELLKEFPIGSNMTYVDRLKIIMQNNLLQLKRIPNNTINTKETIHKAISGIISSPTYVKNSMHVGSLFKGLQQLMISEQIRLSNKAENILLQSSGVVMLYWRLSPEHIFRGGTEICEVYSNKINRGVVNYLNSNNIKKYPNNINGLYMIEDYPYYPHPHCMCYPEPLIVKIS